ncbi:MAG: NADH:flavin oxidoreductase [Deferrisomatales bacterium]|nr:NADH:flavin oxidoreductase [Deferrisomatales bacterium]
MADMHDPLVLNGLRLRNRLVLPPVTTNFGTADGQVTDDILGFYERRARDVGMVVVEATAVRGDGRLVTRSLGIWDDAQQAGMARLAETIQARGAAATLQINHGGARCTPLGGEFQGASPSGFRFRPDVVPFVLDPGQIAQLVEDFVAAGVRARAAGFDAVEIHGAHLYLIGQFLSPLTNTREDRYGGDAAGRATFAVEIAQALRARLGADAPLLFRMNGVEEVAGGQTLEDAVIIAREMARAGVDAIDVSLSTLFVGSEVDGQRLLAASSALGKDRPAGAGVPHAAAIKRGSGLPVVAVGKLGEPQAARALGSGSADLVAIGRQLIADPDTAGKLLSGRAEEIVPCTECRQCFATIHRGLPMGCAVNGNPAGEPVFGGA